MNKERGRLRRRGKKQFLLSLNISSYWHEITTEEQTTSPATQVTPGGQGKGKMLPACDPTNSCLFPSETFVFSPLNPYNYTVICNSAGQKPLVPKLQQLLKEVV